MKTILSNFVNITQVEEGEVFLVLTSGELKPYMKIVPEKGEKGEHFNAVNLEEGTVVSIPTDMGVIPVNANLLLEGEY